MSDAAAKPQTLTPMGRALLQGFADNIDQMTIPFPDATAAAIRQAFASIDAQAERIATLERELESCTKAAQTHSTLCTWWRGRAEELEAALALASTGKGEGE